MKPKLLFLLAVLVFSGCQKKDSLVPPPVTPPANPDTLRVPKLSTNPATKLSLYSVVLGGVLNDTGSSRVIEAGLVIDTVSSPTTTKNVNKFIRQPNNNGEFSTTVIDLPAGKTWYVRAYGQNAQGVGYGNEVTFTSLQEKVYIGDVTLLSQQDVNSFGANNYTTIRGSLYISGAVTDLSPLKSLAIITSGFEVKNTQLVNFNGLGNLEVIGNEFIRSFEVKYNPLLKNFEGLKSLKVVNGDFYVLNNAALENMAGLESFNTSAYFEFRIDGCDNLTSLTGLENMQVIHGSIMLKDNPRLNDVKAWRNLSIVSDRIRIINNASLQNVDCFEKIKKLRGVEIINNPVLSNINGLRNLDTVTKNFNTA